MTLYKVSLRKAFDSSINPRRKWSTTFLVNTQTAIGAATVLVDGWRNFLSAACRANVYAYQAYATSVLAGDEDYAIVNVPLGDQRGQIPRPNDDPYKPTVCIAVEINTVGGGRPSRKFWRPGLFEGDITQGSSLVGNIDGIVRVQFGDFFDNYTGVLVDPDGQSFIAGAPITRLSDRRFGKESSNNLPNVPPQG